MTRKNPSRVPTATSDLERSVWLKRVAKVVHLVASGSRSHPKNRPTKNRKLSSMRTIGESVNGADDSKQPQVSTLRLLVVRRNSSSVPPPRQRGRSTNHTS